MSKMLKCFISAPINTDTSVLRKILNDHNVNAFDSYDFQIGDSISQEIRSKIRMADFAIIVLFGNNPNVIYEMGICDGLNKPTLLLVGKGGSLINVQSRVHFVVRDEKLEYKEFLKITIENYVAGIQSKKITKKRRPITKKTKLGQESKLNDYLLELKHLRSQPNEQEITTLLEKVFKLVGVQAVTNEHSAADKGVDIALWNSQLESSVGNPILVEVKAGNINSEIVRSATTQLHHYLNLSNAKAGILLYLDSHGKRFDEHNLSSPLILCFDLAVCRRAI